MRKTPSDLKTGMKPMSDKEIELKRWIEELRKDCPEIHPYFIEHMAKAYQLNPKKFDDIIENNIKVEPLIERIRGGVMETVKVYKNIEELKRAEKSEEKK